MKWISTIVVVFIALAVNAQRDFTPNSKKEAFGKRDLRSLANYGLQFQLGGTYLMTRLPSKNQVYEINQISGGFRGNFHHHPKGQLGAYAEIGMFHFPKKRSKLSLALKTVLVSYYDWGIGFKYFRGTENISHQLLDAVGSPLGDPIVTPYRLEHGHVFARFSLHKNVHFKSKKNRGKTNFFLDNSLGINVDYRVLTKSEPYLHDYPIVTDTVGQQYSSPLHIQLHYGLGFGFRLKRGAYLIPGVRAPLLGFQMTNAAPSNSVSGQSTFGNPSIRWFSSKYWPLLFHVKYMFAFQKKNKNGCPPAEINDQDRGTQQNR